MLNAKTVKLYGKLFLKSKVAFIPIVLLFFSIFGALIVQMISGNSVGGIVSAIGVPLNFSVFVFLVFAFVSFDISYKIRQYNLDESISIMPSGKKKLYLSHGIIFLFLILLCFLFLNLWTILLYAKYHVWDAAFSMQTFLNMILCYFLLPCCAVTMGVVFSLLFKRLNACLALTLFVLLGSPLSNGMASVILDMTKVNIYPFIKLFDIFPPSLDWNPVYAYGQSILPHRWETVLFWLFLFCCIICWKIKKIRIRDYLISAVFLVLSVACVVPSLLPSSKLLVSSDDPNNSIMSDWQYYYVTHPKDDIEEEKDFDITDYDLQITIKNKLYVTAALSVNQKNLDEYKFTLYHGFKISSVKNSKGQSLKFKQFDDYFVVDNNGTENDEFIITYSGYSGIYYSNQQGMFLPGYFPYYPQSGIRFVYDREFQGVNQLLLDHPTPFHVKVKSSQPVFCNLEEVEQNTYKGVSNGLTLLSGMYKCFSRDGVSILYPYLDPSLSDDVLNHFVDTYYGIESFPKEIKKVFITPSINNISAYTYYCQFSDHMDIQSVLELDTAYREQKISAKKKALNTAYQMYVSDPTAVRNHVQEQRDFIKENYPGIDPKDLYEPSATEYLVDYLEKYGETAGLEKIKNYLMDDADTRHWKDFVLN